jgi:hypothetical protein
MLSTFPNLRLKFWLRFRSSILVDECLKLRIIIVGNRWIVSSICILHYLSSRYNSRLPYSRECCRWIVQQILDWFRIIRTTRIISYLVTLVELDFFVIVELHTGIISICTRELTNHLPCRHLTMILRLISGMQILMFSRRSDLFLMITCKDTYLCEMQRSFLSSYYVTYPEF